MDDTWETFGEGLSNSVEAVRNFHKKHPKAIKPPNLHIWLRERLGDESNVRSLRLTKKRTHNKREIKAIDFAYDRKHIIQYQPDARLTAKRRQMLRGVWANDKQKW